MFFWKIQLTILVVTFYILSGCFFKLYWHLILVLTLCQDVFSNCTGIWSWSWHCVRMFSQTVLASDPGLDTVSGCFLKLYWHLILVLTLWRHLILMTSCGSADRDRSLVCIQSVDLFFNDLHFKKIIFVVIVLRK